MANKVSPKSYARAIFEIALERNELDKWQYDLDTMVELAKDAVLLTLLQSPKLKFEDKAKMVNDRLPELGTLTRNLAYLLVVKRKMNLIGGIANQYQKMVDNYHGIEHAEITTAIPLEDADKIKMEKVLSKTLGKKLIIETKVDPAIIGGLVVRVNGKLLEGSTRNKLLSLKKELGGHK
jgi:F-type H+-transporting ATPase subunit delta